MTQRALPQAALSQSDLNRRPLRAQRRTGNDVHDTAGAVGSVKRGSGPEDDLDALDVVIDHGNKIVGIQAQRRHAGQAVVRQRQQGAGKDVVEAAHHDVTLDQTVLGVVDTGQIAHVLGHAEHGPVLNLLTLYYGD